MNRFELKGKMVSREDIDIMSSIIECVDDLNLNQVKSISNAHVKTLFKGNKVIAEKISNKDSLIIRNGKEEIIYEEIDGEVYCNNENEMRKILLDIMKHDNINSSMKIINHNNEMIYFKDINGNEKFIEGNAIQLTDSNELIYEKYKKDRDGNLIVEFIKII